MEFSNENGINVYSIKFSDNISYKKKDIIFDEVNDNSIFVSCEPFCQLDNEKWVFMINRIWILLLKQNYKNYKIFELEKAEKIQHKNNGSTYNLFEINEDKFLIYEKNSPYIYDLDHPSETKIITRIYIFNSKTAYMNKKIIIPFTSSIRNLFYLENYKNIVLFL